MAPRMFQRDLEGALIDLVGRQEAREGRVRHGEGQGDGIACSQVRGRGSHQEFEQLHGGNGGLARDEVIPHVAHLRQHHGHGEG